MQTEELPKGRGRGRHRAKARPPLLTTSVRFPADLSEKLRVIAIADGSVPSEILDRMTRGPIEAEFDKLPKAIQNLARKSLTKPR